MTNACDQPFTNKSTVKRVYHGALKKARTREIAEREISEIRAAEVKADAIL